jgi:cell division protein FtsB
MNEPTLDQRIALQIGMLVLQLAAKEQEASAVRAELETLRQENEALKAALGARDQAG